MDDHFWLNSGSNLNREETSMAKLTMSAEEEGMRPSAVFARRLRETRKARGFSQSELVARMSAAGRPLGKASLLRIENMSREPTLDEMLGLAETLKAAPVNLLSPPGDEMLALTGKMSVDHDALRNWLLTGFPFRAPLPHDRAALRLWLEGVVTGHAAALADASRVNDRQGIVAAVDAIIASVREYQEALEALTA
jgi:transcriptional regulator with XRE-family HTH domain